jgi:hypothetical protein
MRAVGGGDEGQLAARQIVLQLDVAAIDVQIRALPAADPDIVPALRGAVEALDIHQPGDQRRVLPVDVTAEAGDVVDAQCCVIRVRDAGAVERVLRRADWAQRARHLLRLRLAAIARVVRTHREARAVGDLPQERSPQRVAVLVAVVVVARVEVVPDAVTPVVDAGESQRHVAAHRQVAAGFHFREVVAAVCQQSVAFRRTAELGLVRDVIDRTAGGVAAE